MFWVPLGVLQCLPCCGALQSLFPSGHSKFAKAGSSTLWQCCARSWVFGGCSAVGLAPSATIHGLYKASPQPDGAKVHVRGCGSPKALLHGKNLVAWTLLKAKLLSVIYPLRVRASSTPNRVGKATRGTFPISWLSTTKENPSWDGAVGFASGGVPGEWRDWPPSGTGIAAGMQRAAAKADFCAAQSWEVG